MDKNLQIGIRMVGVVTGATEPIGSIVCKNPWAPEGSQVHSENKNLMCLCAGAQSLSMT